MTALGTRLHSAGEVLGFATPNGWSMPEPGSSASGPRRVRRPEIRRWLEAQVSPVRSHATEREITIVPVASFARCGVLAELRETVATLLRTCRAAPVRPTLASEKCLCRSKHWTSTKACWPRCWPTRTSSPRGRRRWRRRASARSSSSRRSASIWPSSARTRAARSPTTSACRSTSSNRS